MPLTEPLLDRTRRLLTRCDLKQKEIARRAGVGLPWLKKFSRNKDADASVKLTQQLHDFLDLYEQAKANARPGSAESSSATPAA